MRRTIRLTGRKELPRNSAAISLRDVGGKKLLTLTIQNPKTFKRFPQTARVEVRLIENKQMELVDFGALGALNNVVELGNQAFGDPSCQLRIASSATDNLGLLLGSTKSWRLNSDDPDKQGTVRGLLDFLPAKIAPRTWRLRIEENVRPLIEIDNRIPDPRAWAKSDPVFIGTIMPAIIHQLFDDILSHQSPEDTEWMNDWLRWADMLMAGNTPPPYPNEVRTRREWIDSLIDTFSRRHNLSDRIVDRLLEQGKAA
jgi:hypothetical protein